MAIKMNKIKELIKRYNDWWFDVWCDNTDLSLCSISVIALTLTLSFVFLGLFVRVLNTTGTIPLGIIVLALLIVMECIYWADDEKKELNSFWGGIKYALHKKIDALDLTLKLFFGYTWIILSPVDIVLGYYYDKESTTAFLAVFGILGIILGVVVVYLWLNSLKYRRRGDK